MSLSSSLAAAAPDVATLAVFVPAAALVASTPGANNLLALSYGMQAGFVSTVVSLAGRMAAFSILIALVAFGFGALIATSHTAFVALKWAGVAYLVWIGLSMWRAPVEEATPEEARAAAMVPPWQLARSAFWVAMMNPKSILIFTAFVPQFVSPGAGNATLSFAVLSAFYLVFEFSFAALYAAAGTLLRRFAMTAARRRIANRITGGMMLSAAGLLAATQR